MKKSIKKTVSVLLSCVLSIGCCMLAGCQDMGNYLKDYVPGQEHPHTQHGGTEQQNMEAYYGAYDKTTAMHCGTSTTIGECAKIKYDISTSLYNKRTVTDLSWNTDEGDVPVETKAYVYLAVPIKQALTIESVALYAKASNFEGYTSFDHSAPPMEFPDMEEWMSTISVFLLESESQLPKKVRRFGDPEKELVPLTDEHGNPKIDEITGEVIMEEALIEYDDPTNPVATGHITFEAGRWTSFLIEKDWTVDDVSNRTLSVAEGNVLLIRFDTNLGNVRGKCTKCYFNFTNLMIRVVG